MRKGLLSTLALLGFVAVAIPQEAQQKQNPDVARILAQLGPNANKPAGEVFKNVQILKDMPAKRLLAVMEQGYSRALGVDCSHCHVEDRWEADEKRQKLAARDMIVMMRDLNATLAKMQNLEMEGQGKVNCTTCHRGQVKPALEIK